MDTVGPADKYQVSIIFCFAFHLDVIFKIPIAFCRQEKLSKIFPDFKITVASKADATYPCVSAASICAKVARDCALKVWTFAEGLEIPEDGWGSGYPNGKNLSSNHGYIA